MAIQPQPSPMVGRTVRKNDRVDETSLVQVHWKRKPPVGGAGQRHPRHRDNAKRQATQLRGR